MPPAGDRVAVVHLYRRALRAAARCPDARQRATMLAYARNSFRQGASERDTARIRTLLADAHDQISRMEYFHSVVEQSKHAPRVAGSLFSDDQDARDFGVDAPAAVKPDRPGPPTRSPPATSLTSVDDAVFADLRTYARRRGLRDVDLSDWDLDELRGLSADDAAAAWRLSRIDAARLVAKIRGLLQRHPDFERLPPPPPPSPR